MQEPTNQEVEVQSPNLLQLQNAKRNVKKQNRIKIDIGKTQYPLLRAVATGQLGWRVWTRQESKEEVNVYWNDTYVHEEFVRKMKPYQRVNHFPGSECLGKKNLLTASLNRMKKMALKQYEFFPMSFNFPSEVQQFQRFSKNRQNPYYIVKPSSDSQGRGIYLTKQPDLNCKEEIVVQEYVDDPLLIDSAKFDLRLYVLLRSVNPLKIYLFSEGLSRLATCSYEKPSSSNQKNMRVHLTNYAINKASPDFIFNQSELEDDIGHKRSLNAIYRMLEKKGCDVEHLRKEIDKIIVKTIIAGHHILNKKYKEAREIKDDQDCLCFEILGFDILIKEDFTPLLLQVNHSPSFCTQTPLDMIIKKHLLLDTLNMLNLNKQDKINYLKSRNEQDNIHNIQIMRTYNKNTTKEAQSQQLGAFRRLYPLDIRPQNEQTIKIYESLLKLNKKQKTVRSLVPPITRKLPFSNEKYDEPFLNHIRQRGNSISYYQVVSNFKRTKLRQLRDVVQHDQLSPSSLPVTKNMLDDSPPPIEFHSEQEIQLIKKEEGIMYDKRVKRDRQKEKKKYILPMQVNNVNIKFDDKFIRHTRQTKSSSVAENIATIMPENQFKIHSMFNTTIERRKRDDAIRTANKETRNESSIEDKFRATDRSNKIVARHSYSIELKQKLERMQLARLRIQKVRKADRNGFMVIRSNSPEK